MSGSNVISEKRYFFNTMRIVVIRPEKKIGVKIDLKNCLIPASNTLNAIKIAATLNMKAWAKVAVATPDRPQIKAKGYNTIPNTMSWHSLILVLISGFPIATKRTPVVAPSALKMPKRDKI